MGAPELLAAPVCSYPENLYGLLSDCRGFLDGFLEMLEDVLEVMGYIGKQSCRRYRDEPRQQGIFHHVLSAGIAGETLHSNEGPLDPPHDDPRERRLCHSPSMK